MKMGRTNCQIFLLLIVLKFLVFFFQFNDGEEYMYVLSMIM